MNKDNRVSSPTHIALSTASLFLYQLPHSSKSEKIMLKSCREPPLQFLHIVPTEGQWLSAMTSFYCTKPSYCSIPVLSLAISWQSLGETAHQRWRGSSAWDYLWSNSRSTNPRRRSNTWIGLRGVKDRWKTLNMNTNGESKLEYRTLNKTLAIIIVHWCSLFPPAQYGGLGTVAFLKSTL